MEKKDEMSFSYDFKICPICDEAMDEGDYLDFTCRSGCCVYEIDPQSDNVSVSLFNGKWYMLPLSAYSLSEYAKELKEFLVEVSYWKEKNKTEGWELEKSFPKLSKVLKKYSEKDEESNEYDTSSILEKMEKIERIRYISKLLVKIDLPYEFNYGIGELLKEFLNAIENKEELKAYESEMNSLRDIVNTFNAMTQKKQIDATRSHPLMKKAEEWAEGFTGKGNGFIETVEKMTDENLLN